MRKYFAYSIGNTDGYTVVTYKSDGTVYSSRNVLMPMYEVCKEGVTYFIQLDAGNKVIHQEYRYINRKRLDSGYNTRKQIAKGLRLLYCFLEITHYDMHSLNESQIGELVMFLRGLNVSNSDTVQRTIRSNVTVNIYLSIIRDYFKFMGVSCEPLTRASVKKATVTDNAFSSTITRVTYDINLPTKSTDTRMVPKYISPEQFKKLFNAVASHNDKTALILMHLMYGYGLRLGECLGLCAPEDVQQVHRDNRLVPVLIIRNRLSDEARFQSAKGKMHVLSTDQYRTRDYQKDKDEIVLTWDFYKQFIEYINDTQEYFMEKFPDNYKKGIADIVSTRDKPEFNHYIFMNRYGKRLSDQTWNNTLKWYFAEAGIPIDHDVKEEGLSHRFRHGFAMFHAQFSPHPIDALKLSKMMRHSSPATTMIYYNPTPEDELQLKEEVQQYLYQTIPELLVDPFTEDDKK